MASERVYTGGAFALYIQETTTSQLDSVSGSSDTTQILTGEQFELRITNNIAPYKECDGTVKYFEGPQQYSIRVDGKIATGELLSAIIGADSLSSLKYTISKYSVFLPRFTFHGKLDLGNGQILNITLTNCIVGNGTISIEGKNAVAQGFEIFGEAIGTTDWKVLS